MLRFIWIQSFTKKNRKMIRIYPQLFDFLYYKSCKFYESFGEKGADGSGAIVVSLFMIMNILSILIFISHVTDSSEILDQLLIVCLCAIVLILNYVRFLYMPKRSLAAIERKWQSRSVASRRVFSFFITLYGVISVIACIGLATYVGSQRS